MTSNRAMPPQAASGALRKMLIGLAALMLWLGLNVPWALADAGAVHYVSGSLWDMRYGEAVLGKWGVSYAPSLKAYVNGRQISASELEKPNTLEPLLGCSAFGSCDALGRLLFLDIVAPQTAEETGPLERPEASAPCAGTDAALELSMLAPPGGQAVFRLTGLALKLQAEEKAPGIYKARYPVPEGAELREARVLGIWNGGKKSYIRVGSAVEISPNSPSIISYGPRMRPSGEEVRLFAVISADGTDIAPGQARLWIGKREITARAERIGNVLQCTLPKDEIGERPLFCVKITDRCGRSAKQYWRWD
ncbi:hypothetical protein IJT17_09060 [bacterium]|nr:hypothetical protein [bacterium]